MRRIEIAGAKAEMSGPEDAIVNGVVGRDGPTDFGNALGAIV